MRHAIFAAALLVAIPFSDAAEDSDDLGRLQLLQSIHEQRLVLFAERDRLELQITTVRKELLAKQGEFNRLERDALRVQAAATALAGEIDQLRADQNVAFDQITALQIGNAIEQRLAEGRRLEQRYGQLDAAASGVRTVGEGLQSELEQFNQAMEALYDQADSLRREWLDLVDPFGKLEREEHEAAILAFSEWIVLDGQNADAYVARGFAYWHLDEIDKALDDFGRAAKLHSGGLAVEGLCARALLLASLGRDRQSSTDFGRAFKLDGRNAVAYLFRGLARCADGKFSSGVADFKAALQRDPENAEVSRCLALLYSTCERPAIRNAKKAIKYAEEACQLTGNKDCSCLLALAAAHAEDGQFADALRCLDDAEPLAAGEQLQICKDRRRSFRAKQPIRLDWTELHLQ